MKRRLYIRNSDRGFTLIEMMAVLSVSMILISMGVSATISAREAIVQDYQRTKMNQQLRGALDIVSANIREAGENLVSSFPAIEIVDGGAGPDELVVRRALVDEVLTLCQTVTQGAASNLYMALTYPVGTDPTPGCIYSDNLQNYTSWNSHRTSLGGTARGYIFNRGTKEGQFFDFNSMAQNGSEMYLHVTTPWQFTFPVVNDGSPSPAAAYIIEELRFYIDTSATSPNTLMMMMNEEEATVQNIAPDVSSFNVRAFMQDGSVLSSFNRSNSWSLLRGVEVSFGGVVGYRERLLQTTVSSRFVPRNVFSQ